MDSDNLGKKATELRNWFRNMVRLAVEQEKQTPDQRPGSRPGLFLPTQPRQERPATQMTGRVPLLPVGATWPDTVYSVFQEAALAASDASNWSNYNSLPHHLFQSCWDDQLAVCSSLLIPPGGMLAEVVRRTLADRDLAEHDPRFVIHSGAYVLDMMFPSAEHVAAIAVSLGRDIAMLLPQLVEVADHRRIWIDTPATDLRYMDGTAMFRYAVCGCLGTQIEGSVDNELKQLAQQILDQAARFRR